MVRNIIWKGLEADSMEFCRIYFDKSIEVKSSIIGCSDDIPFKVDYELVLSEDWVISNCDIRARLGNMEQSLHLNHNGHGNWFNNGHEWKHLEGCLDIDISLTPFTNSLPLNRIKTGLDQNTDIEVAYIDVLDFGINKEIQHYQRLESNVYNFANNDKSFIADITVGEFNLVTHYPGLFELLLLRD